VTVAVLRKQFRFKHARPVGQRERIHRIAGDLVMRPLLDHQPARHGRFADFFLALDGEFGRGVLFVLGDEARRLNEHAADEPEKRLCAAADRRVRRVFFGLTGKVDYASTRFFCNCSSRGGAPRIGSKSG